MQVLPGDIVLDFDSELQTATSRIATPTIPVSEPEPRLIQPASEIAEVSASTRAGLAEGETWTASGEADGSKVVATVTRRDDTLELSFDVDHRDAVTNGQQFPKHYVHVCSVPASDPVIECWMSGRHNSKAGAKVFGTFPRLAYRMQWPNGYAYYTLPGDIVLDFRPELNPAALKIATPAAPAPELRPVRPEPEADVVSLPAQDTIPDGSRWTASGEADGSRIVAIATRRGDVLKLVFDVDHRGSMLLGGSFHRHSDTCTVLVSHPVIECWIPSRPNLAIGAKVFGTFPRLTYQMRNFEQTVLLGYGFTIPGDIVLDFRPNQELAQQ
jgi:hypothetical protein